MLKYILDEGRNILKKDPAAKTLAESIFLYPSLKALVYHKIAHRYYKKNRLFIARFLSQRARKITGIEIHPGATIGRNVFIDHGMGVVIGETAIVGNNVTIFHGSTLGGIGGEKGEKRHPTVEDDVLIGAGAKVLGNVTIGKGAKIGANAIVLNDIPPYRTAVGIPAKVIEDNDRIYEVK